MQKQPFSSIISNLRLEWLVGKVQIVHGLVLWRSEEKNIIFVVLLTVVEILIETMTSF